MYKIFENITYEELHRGKTFWDRGDWIWFSKIKENFVFVAMMGSVVDGHNFIQKAIDSGAKMVIVEKKVNVEDYKDYENVTFIFVENVRKKLGVIASNYYDYPQNKIKIIGITGTMVRQHQVIF